MILFWVISKLLGPERFGEYSYCVVIIEILIVLGSLGISKSVPRYLAEFVASNKTEEARAMISTVFRYKIGLSLIVMVGFAATYKHIPGISKLDAGLIWVIVIAVICGSVLETLQSVVDALLQNRFKFIVYTLGSLFRISATYYFVSKYPSVELVILIGVGVTVLSSGIHWIYNKDLIPLTLTLKLEHENARRVKNSFGYLSLSAVFTFIIWHQSEMFFLQHYSSAYELGLYGFAFSLSMRLVQYVPSTFISILIPFLSHLKNEVDIKLTHYYLSKYVLIVSFIVAVALVRPNGFEGLKVKSVKKKLKNKGFAKAVDRTEIEESFKGLDIDFTQHLQLMIDSLIKREEELKNINLSLID